MAQRKNLDEHPLLQVPFWSISFPKLRPLLAHWQTVSVLYLVNNLEVDDDTCVTVQLDKFGAGQAHDIDEIRRAYERTIGNNDDQVYILQYAGLLYRLELLEDETEHESLKAWIETCLCDNLKKGSYEALMLLKCFLSWGLKFRGKASEMIVLIRSGFLGSTTDKDRLAVVGDVVETLFSSV
jgi:hypothetical protein